MRGHGAITVEAVCETDRGEVRASLPSSPLSPFRSRRSEEWRALSDKVTCKANSLRKSGLACSGRALHRYLLPIYSRSVQTCAGNKGRYAIDVTEKKTLSSAELPKNCTRDSSTCATVRAYNEQAIHVGNDQTKTRKCKVRRRATNTRAMGCVRDPLVSADYLPIQSAVAPTQHSIPAIAKGQWLSCNASGPQLMCRPLFLDQCGCSCYDIVA